MSPDPQRLQLIHEIIALARVKYPAQYPVELTRDNLNTKSLVELKTIKARLEAMK